MTFVQKTALSLVLTLGLLYNLNNAHAAAEEEATPARSGVTLGPEDSEKDKMIAALLQQKADLEASAEIRLNPVQKSMKKMIETLQQEQDVLIERVQKRLKKGQDITQELMGNTSWTDMMEELIGALLTKNDEVSNGNQSPEQQLAVLKPALAAFADGVKWGEEDAEDSPDVTLRPADNEKDRIIKALLQHTTYLKVIFSSPDDVQNTMDVMLRGLRKENASLRKTLQQTRKQAKGIRQEIKDYRDQKDKIGKLISALLTTNEEVSNGNQSPEQQLAVLKPALAAFADGVKWGEEDADEEEN